MPCIYHINNKSIDIYIYYMISYVYIYIYYTYIYIFGFDMIHEIYMIYT